MTTRTTKAAVTFGRPFVVSAYDEPLPAGTYDVEFDEQLLDGVSFPVYRRVVALLSLPVAPERANQHQILAIDPNELDEALARDRAAAGPVAAQAVEATSPEAASDPPSEAGDDRSAAREDDASVIVRW